MEPVYVQPAAIVRFYGRACAEKSGFGAYPFAFTGLERLADGSELFAVVAVTERAACIFVETDAQVEVGASCGCHFGVHGFGLALVGLAATGLRQSESVFRVFQYQAGIVKPHANQAGTFAAVFGAGREFDFGRHGEFVGRCFLEQQVGYIPQVFAKIVIIPEISNKWRNFQQVA